MKNSNALHKKSFDERVLQRNAIHKNSAKMLASCLMFLMLQGCELVSQKSESTPVVVSAINEYEAVVAINENEIIADTYEYEAVIDTNEYELCVTPLQHQKFTDFCGLDNWLVVVLEMSEMTWPMRLTKITEMGDDPRSLLIKILLSKATDTPYRQRLLAQNWVEKISGESSPAMQKILDELVYQNSQQLLEYESAITLLSRVNARQQTTISELQEQLDQLLKIETDLSEQNRSEEKRSVE